MVPSRASPSRAVAGQEKHSHAVALGDGQGDPQPLGLVAEELVGHLEENARPVAGRFVGAGRPSVHQVQQDPLAVFDNRVIGAPLNIDNGPNAAGVVFPLGIVQAAIG